MAFANIAGRAGFVIDLDKTALDRGLPQAERQFDKSTRSMEESATRSNVSVARSFEPLLARTRAMQREADVLAQRASGMGRGLEGAAAGAGTLDRGMGSLVGRAGLLSAGLSIAYYGSRQLQESLQKTGAEAVTVEGRLSNVGAALLKGDLVGGIKALNAGVETFDDLGLAAKDAGGALDDLERLADSQGGKWRRIYDEARLVADAYREIAAASREILTASVGFRSPTGQLLAGGFASGIQPFPQAPLADRLRAAGFVPTEGVQRPIGPTARNRAAQTVAQAEGDLPELLRLQTVERDRLTKAIENSHGNVRQREALNAQLGAARASVISTQKQIEANRQAEAATAKSAAEAREADQARAVREGISTREQLLRNQYEQATATPGLRDDRRRASTLSAFLGARSRDPRLDAGERADFRSRQIAFLSERKRDREQLAKSAMDDTREELRLQEQVLKNNVKAAELTEKNKRDDIRENRRLRDFYRRAERGSSGLERQAFRSDRLDTQEKLNKLLAGGGDDKSLTLAELRRLHVEFLTGLQGMTNQFGSNVTADGAQTATNTWHTSKLMGEQNRLLDRLTRGVQHPGARYARNELMLAFGGVGGI